MLSTYILLLLKTLLLLKIFTPKELGKLIGDSEGFCKQLEAGEPVQLNIHHVNKFVDAAGLEIFHEEYIGRYTRGTAPGVLDSGSYCRIDLKSKHLYSDIPVEQLKRLEDLAQTCFGDSSDRTNVGSLLAEVMPLVNYIREYDATCEMVKATPMVLEKS